MLHYPLFLYTRACEQGEHVPLQACGGQLAWMSLARRHVALGLSLLHGPLDVRSRHRRLGVLRDLHFVKRTLLPAQACGGQPACMSSVRRVAALHFSHLHAWLCLCWHPFRCLWHGFQLVHLGFLHSLHPLLVRFLHSLLVLLALLLRCALLIQQLLALLLQLLHDVVHAGLGGVYYPKASR